MVNFAAGSGSDSGHGLGGRTGRLARSRDGARVTASSRCGLLLVPQGLEDFGGGDDLADVALGVVGDMDQRAADGGGQLLAAHAAKDVEVGAGEGANAGGGVGKRGFDFAEQDGERFAFSAEALCSALSAASCSAVSWPPSA